MPTPLLLTALALLPIDAALRTWTPASRQAPANALYLFLAYGPMLAFPYLGPWGITGLLGGVALFALFNYARMVGLTGEPRFFGTALFCVAAFFAAARAHWYHLFTAMPAFAVCLTVAAASLKLEPQAFLQKLCLSWVGLLVYGYLAGHGALYTDLATEPPGLGGGQGLSRVVLIAKFADVAWAAVRRFSSPTSSAQLYVSPLGGAAGGAVVAVLTGFDARLLALLGLLVGAALGSASRAYNLIVIDVLGTPPDRPLKGSMMFGFAFALALAYHFVRFFWSGGGPIPGGG